MFPISKEIIALEPYFTVQNMPTLSATLNLTLFAAFIISELKYDFYCVFCLNIE
jgi:hypothetical protein